MGRILDAVLAVFALVFFIYIMYRLNITAGDIWTFFRHFFSTSGSTPANTTASFIGFLE